MCSWTSLKRLSDALPASSEVLGLMWPIPPGGEVLIIITEQTGGLSGIDLLLSNGEGRLGGRYPFLVGSCLCVLFLPLPGSRTSCPRGDGTRQEKTSRVRFRVWRTRQKRRLRGRH